MGCSSLRIRSEFLTKSLSSDLITILKELMMNLTVNLLLWRSSSGVPKMVLTHPSLAYIDQYLRVSSLPNLS